MTGVQTCALPIYHFGMRPPDTSNSARLAAIRFSVRDPAAPEAVFKNAAIPYTKYMDRLIVGPDVAMGATLIFDLD